jgi:hypothetical protein
MKGYTPQLRALGTPEGDFHAEFTTTNAKTRELARQLAKAFPTDRGVQSFVSAFSDDRDNLWSTWKRTLPPHLRPIVLSVKDSHRGPRLDESGTAEYRTFLTLVEAVSRRTRRRLDDLLASVPGNAAVSDCVQKFRDRLDNLDAALKKHLAPR